MQIVGGAGIRLGSGKLRRVSIVKLTSLTLTPAFCLRQGFFHTLTHTHAQTTYKHGVCLYFIYSVPVLLFFIFIFYCNETELFSLRCDF